MDHHDDPERPRALHDAGDPGEQARAAMLALERPEHLSLEDEVRLLACLPARPPPATPPSEWAAQRREGAGLWLRARRRLEAELDPSFDVMNRPALNIEPPRGARLPSGAAPEAVADPALRAEYQAAIDRNREKAAAYDRQFELRALRLRLSAEMERYLVTAYSTPPRDLTELRRELDAHLAGDAGEQQKARILAAVSAR
jgi:hypothetical protein